MFQSFTVRSDATRGKLRLHALRKRLATMQLDGFVVPHADAHQNEYLPPNAERLAWLTGFTGSAGTAIVLADSAHIFVDGRYTLQLREQADMDVFTPEDLIDTPPHRWIEKNLPAGTRLGVDPWLHTIGEVERFEKACSEAGATLVHCDTNPLDAVWQDAPPAPLAPVSIHPMEHAGVSAKSKLAALARTVREHKTAATVLTDPASIAWAFNIRGHDVAHTPLALGWAIVPSRGDPLLFIDSRKLGNSERAYLHDHAELHEPVAFTDSLAALARRSRRPIMLDPGRVNAAIGAIVAEAGGKIVHAPDPAIGPRATKNRTERRGAINAQRRDGAAFVRFLAWLDAQAPETLDEITIVRKLETCRAETGERLGMPLRDIAFDTICGSGPNGAIVHYRVDETSNRRITAGDLILIDSGGQYDDGTTDITRVVPTGPPTQTQRRHFTLVLKGMIAMSRARFPQGTRGVDIDALARAPLWTAGLDYKHGTGHGVGSYLSVHEGPQSLSRRGMAELKAGMIVSNEPGCYRPGEYGIRIENLVMVDAARLPEGGDVPVHGFSTLTLVPIDRRLIDPKLLDRHERRWLNRYHARVRRELSPLIEDESVLAWLQGATALVK
ncbi:MULTISPECIES: aminopeptidase P family protein [unclassified Roseitalea]|uniref:aminopeptidase P family protein n=1 Tax=unclassified Roseitalea TaxID=2639107 RepID=UPI00273D6204|nr:MULTISPECIES: aminopeptidase P family protein [unclassified Roseitalea]